MARRSSGPKTFSVKIEGLERMAALPNAMEGAKVDMLRDAADRIAESIGLAAPKRTGKLAASWKSRVLTSTRASVYSNSPYAKAQDRGAYIVPKAKRVLRFQAGGDVQFTKAVRLPAKKYTTKGLRPRRKIINEEFAKHFGHLETSGADV